MSQQKHPNVCYISIELTKTRRQVIVDVPFETEKLLSGLLISEDKWPQDCKPRDVGSPRQGVLSPLSFLWWEEAGSTLLAKYFQMTQHFRTNKLPGKSIANLEDNVFLWENLLHVVLAPSRCSPTDTSKAKGQPSLELMSKELFYICCLIQSGAQAHHRESSHLETLVHAEQIQGKTFCLSWTFFTWFYLFQWAEESFSLPFSLYIWKISHLLSANYVPSMF